MRADLRDQTFIDADLDAFPMPPLRNGVGERVEVVDELDEALLAEPAPERDLVVVDRLAKPMEPRDDQWEASYRECADDRPDPRMGDYDPRAPHPVEQLDERQIVDALGTAGAYR
jgi:hypothetical protein